MRLRFRAAVSAIAILVGVIAVPEFLTAQYGQSTGSIFGKVVDEQGGVLPGVSVIVKGPGAPVTVYSDARGEFRVTNIDPGNYTLTVSLQGFSTVNRENVVVQIGKNTELTIPMKLSAVAATVTVTGEAPILETKRVTTGAQISQQELSSIPTARDPWVILQSSPGVQTDRVNVAGSESGQQSVLTAHGSSSTSGTFTVDGVNLTDMSALGASANY
ncbi:MAG TPA: carboxypeptidase regulatory-like domain-containing protein, partial [Thermoanaerobaculia bacterium]